MEATDSSTRGTLSAVFGWAVQVTDPRFGAVGDGVTDDTAAIQAAIDFAFASGGATVVVPPGTYMINADTGASIWTNAGGIAMRDGLTLWISAGATLKALPVTTVVSKVVRVHECSNVTITGGGTIDGNRDNAVVTTGEWGYGISVNGGDTITIDGVSTINCWGDGINLQRLAFADYTPPRHVEIRGVKALNNRRQGCSIESGWDVLVEASEFSYTNGVLPTCGIDIEPPDANGTVDHLTIRKNIFVGNARAGIQLWESSKTNDIVIENNALSGNGATGSIPQMRIVDGGAGLKVTKNTFTGSSGTIAASIAGPARGGLIQDNTFDRDLEVTGTALIVGFPRGMIVKENQIVGSLRFSYFLSFKIELNTIRPSDTQPCIDFSGVGSSQNGTIQGNTFEGGSYGIYGNQSVPMSFIKVLDNLFQHQRSPAIYVKGGDTLTVEGNTFEGCCLTTGASIIVDVNDTTGAVRRRIERNTFKVAPRAGGPTPTNTPTSCYSSAASVQASSLLDNIKIGTIDMFPPTQATAGGTVFAELGRVPARASTYRPAAPPNGTMMMDLTLGIPIWYRNTAWVNHAGTVVV
ncbi:right-handed parallel beta-helix repeat-containing protein [Microbacterium sp. NPDC087592]|uniref:right-handed parallel beta-helix repeat-containing protein n=1 Tax=Microbacterium sp. NPDC087592 TaxID=3364193 RepID=UPI0037F6716D